ncbi:MAG: hydrogenase, partial [Verrucomicrobia bacterium]|nr:hydrogenase [Verrucomicrobiota bacterium]
MRELQNAIERAVILAQGSALQFDWLKGANPPSTVPVSAPATPPAILTAAELKQRERENLTAALARTGGKIFG